MRVDPFTAVMIGQGNVAKVTLQPLKPSIMPGVIPTVELTVTWLDPTTGVPVTANAVV